LTLEPTAQAGHLAFYRETFIRHTLMDMAETRPPRLHGCLCLQVHTQAAEAQLKPLNSPGRSAAAPDDRSHDASQVDDDTRGCGS